MYLYKYQHLRIVAPTEPPGNGWVGLGIILEDIGIYSSSPDRSKSCVCAQGWGWACIVKADSSEVPERETGFCTVTAQQYVVYEHSTVRNLYITHTASSTGSEKTRCQRWLYVNGKK